MKCDITVVGQMIAKRAYSEAVEAEKRGDHKEASLWYQNATDLSPHDKKYAMAIARAEKEADRCE